MINVDQTLTANDAFVKADYIVLRMYTLLDGFTVETAGLYAYLRSWRNHDESHELFGCVWLSREEIYAQAGIGRKPFDRHLQALMRYGLVSLRKSDKVVNKMNFVVHDPLTEAEFRALYSEAIEAFRERIAAIQCRNKVDQDLFAEKKAEWKAQQVEAADPEREVIADESTVPYPMQDDVSIDQLRTWL